MEDNNLVTAGAVPLPELKVREVGLVQGWAPEFEPYLGEKINYPHQAFLRTVGLPSAFFMNSDEGFRKVLMQHALRAEEFIKVCMVGDSQEEYIMPGSSLVLPPTEIMQRFTEVRHTGTPVWRPSVHRGVFKVAVIGEELESGIMGGETFEFGYGGTATWAKTLFLYVLICVNGLMTSVSLGTKRVELVNRNSFKDLVLEDLGTLLKESSKGAQKKAMAARLPAQIEVGELYRAFDSLKKVYGEEAQPLQMLKMEGVDLKEFKQAATKTPSFVVAGVRAWDVVNNITYVATREGKAEKANELNDVADGVFRRSVLHARISGVYSPSPKREN